MKIKQVEGLSAILDNTPSMADVATSTDEIIICSADGSRSIAGSGIKIDNSHTADRNTVWDSRKVEELFNQAQNEIAAVIAKTSNFTLAFTEAGDYIRYNSSTEGTCTVPPNGTIAFPVNTMIMIRQAGVGTLTMVAGSGVTLNGALNTPGQHKNITLIKIGTNEWDVIGGV